MTQRTDPRPRCARRSSRSAGRLYARGYTASNDGNISVRLDDGRLLMTPKSVCKGFMTPDMMCITDLDGTQARGRPRSLVRDADAPRGVPAAAGRRRRSCTRTRRPPTGFAVAGIPLDRAVLAEVVTTLGSVPIAEYATPSTKELPEAVRKYVKAHDGMLLANHGALTRRRGCLRRVLQDGDDRALRQDQPGGAAARRRAPAVAGGSRSPAGAARACTASRRPAPICPPDDGARRSAPTARPFRRRRRRPRRLVADRARCRRAARRMATGKFG